MTTTNIMNLGKVARCYRCRSKDIEYNDSGCYCKKCGCSNIVIEVA